MREQLRCSSARRLRRITIAVSIMMQLAGVISCNKGTLDRDRSPVPKEFLAAQLRKAERMKHCPNAGSSAADGSVVGEIHAQDPPEPGLHEGGWLLPRNLLTDLDWDVGILSPAETRELLGRPVPLNGVKTALDMYERIGRVANKRIIWIPALTNEQRARLAQPMLKENLDQMLARKSPRTVGELLRGQLTLNTEVGFHRRPTAEEYFVDAAFAHKDAIIIIALPVLDPVGDE